MGPNVPAINGKAVDVNHHKLFGINISHYNLHRKRELRLLSTHWLIQRSNILFFSILHYGIIVVFFFPQSPVANLNLRLLIIICLARLSFQVRPRASIVNIRFFDVHSGIDVRRSQMLDKGFTGSELVL